MPIAVQIPEVAPDTETTSTSLLCQSPKQTCPSTMRMPHEFPWISTVSNPSFYPTHLFGGMDNFFRPNKNSMQSSCQAIFLRWGGLSEWWFWGWRKGKNRLIPRPTSFQGIVFVFGISGRCSTFKAFSNLCSFWGQWLMIIVGLVSMDQLVFVYILDLLTTDGFASFEGVGALPFGIVSDPGPCWPSSCFLTGSRTGVQDRTLKMEEDQNDATKNVKNSQNIKHQRHMGVFLKWWDPQNTTKWSFLVGKPMVVGYHHFRKPPYIIILRLTSVGPKNKLRDTGKVVFLKSFFLWPKNGPNWSQICIPMPFVFGFLTSCR